MPADTYTFIHQQIWVLDGVLTSVRANIEHRLDAGDVCSSAAGAV